MEFFEIKFDEEFISKVKSKADKYQIKDDEDACRALETSGPLPTGPWTFEPKPQAFKNRR